MMLLGDSITQGGEGSYTWRYFLYEDLADSYGPGNYFVGPSQGSFGERARYAVPTGWDTDHAAQSGRTLGCYLDGEVKGSPCDTPSLAADDLAEHRPGLVVMLLGVNDSLLGWSPYSPAEFVDRTGELIALGRSLDPRMSFLLLGPMPVFGTGLADAEARRVEMNDGLARLADELTTETSRVVYADTSSGFDPAVHSIDGIHPNTDGERVIATNVSRALRDQLGLARLNP